VLSQADPNLAQSLWEDPGWAKIAMGRNFGSTIGIAVDRDSKTIWTFDRWAQWLRQFKIAPIRSGTPAASSDELRRRMINPARPLCRPRGQYLGHRQPHAAEDGKGKGHTV
jgi:hypothetical protein